LGIIDRFLEYQMKKLDKQKGNNVFIEKFERIPSSSGGVAIKLPPTVADNLEIEETTEVNIRVKGDGKPEQFTGVLSPYPDGGKLTIERINLDLLNGGFTLEKKLSKYHFQIQREIIHDFLDKKIKIDHIESLLVNPETVKTPVLANVRFFNSDLEEAPTKQPDNNQVIAVKKAVGNHNIFLIQGPPGTGKTTVIAEVIEQLVKKGEKVLLAGQNHVAVDNVLEKVATIHHLNLLRVGKQERINKELVQFNIENLVEAYKVDYISFIRNQLRLSKMYLDLKKANVDRKTLLRIYNEEVNNLSAQYEKLNEIYKQRHFILRDGLNELQPGEIIDAIASLESWLASNQYNYEIILKPLIYNSLDVVFATCIGIKTDPVFGDIDYKFDTVIIDEAGKANIAETLVAIELGKKVILVGDQMQLPPYIDSSDIDEKEPESFPRSPYGSDYPQDDIISALQASFFEFIINRINANKFPGENIEMLNYQHRMHPNIGEFISASFYDGRVKMGHRTHLNKLELPAPLNKEVIFFDTSNLPDRYELTDGFSAKNNAEAATISEIILPKLFEHNVSPDSMAIIAPYKSQVANIQEHIQKSASCNFKNLDISTLDSFQGKEYDIIIFSFTRSSNHWDAPEVDGRKKFTKVGFLDDARRLNVALSRAKKKLILVGNAITLTDSRSHYDRIFNYTQLFKKLVQLSKIETIGNFVNIADIHDFKSPFKAFTEKNKVGQIVTAQVNKIGYKQNEAFGLFVRIDGFSCLLPSFLMTKEFKSKLDSLTTGTEIELMVHRIDMANEQVTVKEAISQEELKANKKIEKLVSWNANISKIKTRGQYKGIVKNKKEYGYFILLDCGLQGLLHNSKIRGNRDLNINEEIIVTVIRIDHKKQDISLEI
jgi:superfamily I DNA and/or RNA helicase